MLDELLADEQFRLLSIAKLMILLSIPILALFLAGFKAAYGRYNQMWPNSVIKVPARWAWFLQESPSLLIPLYYLSSNYATLQPANILILSLFIVHYLHRTLIYPCRIKHGKGTSVFVFIMAISFCTLNGYLQASWHTHYAQYDANICPIGLALFIAGMLINIHSDSVLLGLRQSAGSGYQIPRGGLFEYVSGANFFGECVEWIGYAIGAQSLPSTAFALFTVCIIGPRAYHHHRWYLEKFEDYPKNRKAFIPFIL